MNSLPPFGPARSLLVAAAVALALAAPRGALAQDPAHRSEPARATLRFAGASGAKECGCSGGNVEIPGDRELHILAIGIRMPVFRTGDGRLAVDWVAELLPTVRSRGTAGEGLDVFACGAGLCAFQYTPEPWTLETAGFGALPVGMAASFAPVPRLAVGARAGGGAIRFDRPVPFAAGRRVNFVFDAAATIEWRLSARITASAGLGWNHISNGNTAEVNPGMDTRMAEFGLTIGR